MPAKPNIIVPLSDASAGLSQVGGKGASLARMVVAGLPVPPGFHITTAAYRRFVAEHGLQERILEAASAATPDQPATLEEASSRIEKLFTQHAIPDEIAEAVRRAYVELGGDDVPVAVRSSATAEDLPGASFAGQQETYLNIRGAEAVLAAVQKCWASLWTGRAIGYRARQNIDPQSVALAVVVQELVFADAAGILFTANPVNGRRDEIVINAAWGLGEAIVGGRVTPDTIIADKATGQVTVRETADKQVMTVRTEDGTEERPVPEALRNAPVLDDGHAAELVRLGVQIEQLYDQPMDIEWTFADSQFAIVQARPITALPEPEAPAPTEWEIPDPKALCFRGSIIELLPDPLTPLFSTLGRKAVNRGTVRLFTELLGPGIVSDEICITVNDYAYYQMRITLKFVWRILVGIVAFWPKIRRAEQRWRDEAHPQYVAVIERWQSRPLSELPAADLLNATSQLVAEAVNTYNVLQSGVLGLAMGAEALFTPFYEKLVKRRDDPAASTFMLGFDSMPILAEKSLYDVAQWCLERPGLASYILRTPASQLSTQMEGDRTPPDVDTDDWREWQRRFRAHLEQHGHAIYDLDFAKPVPADAPAPLLETLKMYLNRQGTDPYERQQRLVTQREEATQAISRRLKGLRLKLFNKLLGWAQTYAPLREDSLMDLGLGYPLLRRILRELGRRLVRAGAIEQVDEVYWLYETEAIQAATALDQGTALSSMAELFRQRKAVWHAEKRVTPPPGLPQRSRWTGLLEQVGPARAGEEAGDTIKGVGASPGRVTAPACVLHGPEEFERMKPGNVLVAAITTPAWTPLFAMASAIVTDVGGPLSHGSIVAREYGIPAVLGTGVATRRIQNGQLITVDGSAGEVILVQ